MKYSLAFSPAIYSKKHLSGIILFLPFLYFGATKSVTTINYGNERRQFETTSNFRKENSKSGSTLNSSLVYFGLSNVESYDLRKFRVQYDMKLPRHEYVKRC